MSATDAPRRGRPAGSFPHARTLFRLRGIPVRLDWSWFVIAGLVAFLFHGRMAHPARIGLMGEPVVLGAAAAATALFFLSLLAHEAGHALTSRSRGIPVAGITLFLLGGVTESTREARTARDELVIVGIGPFISIALAAAFAVLHRAVAPVQPYAIVAGYLAWTNLLLGVFNLVPAFPLDGGRLLRAILWAATGHPHRATRWAARVGQGFAAALAAFGLWGLLGSGGGSLGGVWEMLIAVFLYRGAAEAHARARLRERLEGLTAGDLMGSVPPALDPGTTVHEAVARLQERPSLLWPVGDPVAGAISLHDLDLVPAEDWRRIRVGEVAHSAAAATIDAGAFMEEILERLVAAPRQMLIVVSAGRPVGLLTPSLVTNPTKG